METQVPTQEQLPQIRRITSLDDVQRVGPPRQVIVPEKKIRPPQRPKTSITFFILSLLYIVALCVSLMIIYRYDKLYKQLYQISISQKDKINILQDKLLDVNKIRDRLSVSRMGLIRDYLDLGAQNKSLQYKIGDYGALSLTKSSKIDTLEGEMRVLNARIEAANAQNEVLARELNEKNEYIRELTTKLINSIGEQEIMVNENLRLKEEIAILRAQSAEDKDANQ